jgi:hypothetical protein
VIFKDFKEGILFKDINSINRRNARKECFAIEVNAVAGKN